MIPVAEDRCRFGEAVDAETNGLSVDLVDLEPVLGPTEAGSIPALALMYDLDIINGFIKLNTGWTGKGRRERSSTSRRRRERIGNVEQQCGQRCIRMHALARDKQIGAVSSNE